MVAIVWLSKHQTVTAILILVLVLHICFFPFIWGNKTLLAGSRGVPSVMPDGAWYGGNQGPSLYRGNDMGASAWVIEADAALVRHQYLGEKNPPLWNPYLSYGKPLAANMQSQPFYPLYVLYALNPGPRSYNLFILCRFLVAGLCAYLYLRLFLPFAPSLAGGLTFMLSGYYIMFFNMPHLSVEILIPAMFLVTERLLRQATTGNVLSAVLVVFLSIIGGMPESTLLLLTFGYLYFIFRILSDAALRSAAGRHMGYFAGVNVVGFALAAVLLAPFLEYLRVSFDAHQVANVGHITGAGHDHSLLSLFTYVTPAMFGTARSPTAPTLGGYASLRGFFGILAVLFAMFAAGGLIQSRQRRSPLERRVILFFLCSAVVLLLKRFGFPLVNWIGYVPFFQLVWFIKYEEPLLAMAVAVLCAFGVDQVLGQRISRGRLVATLSVAFAILAADLALTLPAVLKGLAAPHEYYLSLGGAAGVLTVVALLLLGFRTPDRFMRRTHWLAAAMVALLVCELAGDYIYPFYYLLTESATNAANPYAGAPYIEFLKSTTTDHERIFGGNGILHPDWAGSFQLGDIRGLDAMYYRKYLHFIRFFLHDEVLRSRYGDLVDRVTGVDDHSFDTELKRRLLQLSSVKYLLSMHPMATDSPVVREIFGQNEGRLAPGREKLIEIRHFTIGGKTKAVLYEHPIYDRLPFAMEVSPAKQRFFFDIAMDPAVYDGSQPLCGDGVEFRMEVRDSAGHVTPLYDRYIDPKHNLAERKWISESIDLSRYLGQSVELLFSTGPGPAGNTCMDWAGWGDPHFNGDGAAPPVFRLVYDREIKIYESPNRLPRASLFSNVEVAADDQAALARLGSPAVDVFRTAVVSERSLRAEDAAAIQKLRAQPRTPAQAARILSYGSQDVRIETGSDHPALLMLNDSDYPGWNVYVDERRSHWVTTDYLFRGVPLQAGRHLVRFRYEPTSFAAGRAISGAGLLCLAGFVAWHRRRQGSRVAEAHLVH